MAFKLEWSEEALNLADIAKYRGYGIEKKQLEGHIEVSLKLKP